MTTNLYLLYKGVYSRMRPKRILKSYATEEKGRKMVEAAKAIVESPSLMAVTQFKEAEMAWIQSSDVSTNVKLIAPRFESAIISGDYFVDRPHVNRAQTGWVADEGTIYCVSTSSKPGQIKIGGTTMNLETRLQKLSTRYGYDDLTIEFAMEVDHVSDVEAYAHTILENKRVARKVKNDSLEWFLSDTNTAKQAVLAAVEISRQDNYV